MWLWWWLWEYFGSETHAGRFFCRRFILELTLSDNSYLFKIVYFFITKKFSSTIIIKYYGIKYFIIIILCYFFKCSLILIHISIEFFWYGLHYQFLVWYWFLHHCSVFGFHCNLRLYLILTIVFSSSLRYYLLNNEMRTSGCCSRQLLF